MSTQATPPFWLRGWHRLLNRADLTGVTGERKGRIAARFTRAEWRFHYWLKELK